MVGKRPIRATYHGRDRWFCPHRLGRNQQGQVRVLCYQYAGESESGLQADGSPANWRCIALEKLSKVELQEAAWRTAPASMLKISLSPSLRRRDTEATA